MVWTFFIKSMSNAVPYQGHSGGKTISNIPKADVHRCPRIHTSVNIKSQCWNLPFLMEWSKLGYRSDHCHITIYTLTISSNELESNIGISLQTWRSTTLYFAHFLSLTGIDSVHLSPGIKRALLVFHKQHGLCLFLSHHGKDPCKARHNQLYNFITNTRNEEEIWIASIPLFMIH